MFPKWSFILDIATERSYKSLITRHLLFFSVISINCFKVV